MKTIQLVLVLAICLAMFACRNTNGNPSSDDYELEPVEIEEEWVECEYCNGRGYFTHTCSTCDGSGRLTSTYTHKQTRSCQSCYGTGIAPCQACGNYGYHICSQCDGVLGKVRCYACDGAGVILRNIGGQLIPTKCGVCDESGYIACDKCNGKGRITCTSCWGKGHINCPTCHGTGGPDLQYSEKIDQEECPTCDGRGKTREICEKCEGEGKIKVEMP